MSDELEFNSMLMETADLLKVYHDALIAEGFEEEQAFIMTLGLQDFWFAKLFGGVLEDDDE